MTGADFAPEIPWLGMYPTWETFIGQMILVIAYAGALVYTFGIKQERAAHELKSEASQIQQNITVVPRSGGTHLTIMPNGARSFSRTPATRTSRNCRSI